MTEADYELQGSLPASLDAEKSILGAVLLDSTHWLEASVLTPEHFSLDANRRIFARMRDLGESSRPIDTITLSNELARHKEVGAAGGMPYISSLIDGVPERPSIAQYVRILQEYDIRRRAIRTGEAERVKALLG